MTAPQFQKATRQAVKLKLAVSGPSGAGKTLGALALARGLAAGGRVALIDTENGSASLYGDKFDFDTLNLAPPFTSARYLEAIDAAVEAGYAVIVIDSLSHQWSGEGGILSRKEDADKRPGSNSYTNWSTFTKEHTGFLSKLLQLPVHVIATMRAKQDYILETNERGKQQPKKVGMAPVQREGLEYEFTTVFELQMDHRAISSKDRTGLFTDEPVDLLNPKLGKTLLAWLATAKPLAPMAPATTNDAEHSRPAGNRDNPVAALQPAGAAHGPSAAMPATTAQLEKLRFLLTDESLPEDVRAKIESGMKRGITSAKAGVWIRQLEERAPRLPNGAEALPMRGNPMVHNGTYEPEPTPEMDDENRPVPREISVEPSGAEETATGDDGMDAVTGRPLTTAGQWAVPAGEFRDRAIGTLTNEQLVRLRDDLQGMKKFAGTIDQIDNVLEERRELSE